MYVTYVCCPGAYIQFLSSTINLLNILSNMIQFTLIPGPKSSNPNP
jgi:hypothetical protein